MSFYSAAIIAASIIAIALFIFFKFLRRGAPQFPPLIESLDEGGSGNGRESDWKAAGRNRFGQNKWPWTVRDGRRGEPKTCPVCAALFERGEMIISKIFPSSQKEGRLLHISGCPYCVAGGRRRECPVCGAELDISEYLSARIFERKGKARHVHILGCNHCRLNK